MTIQLEILGSGGAVAIPRALCSCSVCAEAAAKGVPYARCGPAYFLHGPNVLFDTPEEIRLQLVRSGITEISACVYSHWHPDHTMGRRILEFNVDFNRDEPKKRQTPVYLPQQVADDARKRLSIMEDLKYLESVGAVRVVEMRDGDAITIGGTRITPFRLAEQYVYAFLIETAGARVLLAPDELFDWTPPDSLGELDLAVVPTGMFEFNPLSGARRFAAGYARSKREATFEETLAAIPKLRAKKIVMSHIEEPDGLSYGDLCELEKKLAANGARITFAYDQMRLPIG